EWQPKKLRICKPEADERPKHHEIALGEIHGFCCLVDQHEAHRDKAVDTAIGETAHNKLQDVQSVPPFFADRRQRQPTPKLTPSFLPSSRQVAPQGAMKTFPFGFANS